MGYLHPYVRTILLLLTLTQTSTSYNLEGKLPLFKYGPATSNFGFSVSQHRISTDDTSGMLDTLLVVGAPTADATDSQRGRNTPSRPGGVFYCPVSTNPSDCRRVDMDAGGDTVITRTGTKNIKTNQWLGVSLKSQGPGKFLVSCAHRYTQHLFTNTGSEKEVERVCGKCFLLNVTSSRRIVEIPPNSPSLTTDFISSPCDVLAGIRESLLSTKLRYGYMQAGTSISLENEEYLLGAPGTWSWSGALFDISMPSYSNDSPLVALFSEASRTPTFSQTPTCFAREKKRDPLQLKCDKLPLQRDGYMGFSVATSNMIEGGEKMYYAAGAPRGNNTGAVVFFKKIPVTTDQMTLVPDPSNIVVGESIGSSFGYSIALTDINADGLDDLIVGAPQFFEYSNRRKAGGAIYIYRNQNGIGFRDIDPQVFYGNLDSYFGHAVAPVGDIDQDGYNDFAVGAPYEGENGAVHIYRGSSDGMVKESQVVKAADYPFVHKDNGREIAGFGASLSGRVDADSNKYPDLLIGSFSDHVTLLRSRPIIRANMTFEVSTHEIDLDVKNCSSGDEMFSCFNITYCFIYTARHSEYTEEVPTKYKIVLDSIRQGDNKSPRVHLDSENGLSVIEAKMILPGAGIKVCPGNSHTAYFSNDVEDRLSSIGLNIEFDLDFPEVKREGVGEAVFKMINDPILDADLDKRKKRIVRIKNTCGDDGCQSNLKVNASMPEEVVVGDDATLPIKISISNDGEEAHQSYITVTIPSSVDFDSYTVKKPSNSDIECYASGESAAVRCDIGNPYEPATRDEIEINIAVSRLTSQDKSIQLKVEGYTSSENPEISPIILQAKVWIELNISLTVFAQPEQVMYAEKDIIGESGMNTTENIGPYVVYTFNVRNEALQPASGVGLSIDLPIEIYNGKWLLYLVSSDVNAGKDIAVGSCSGEYVNELQLEPSLQVSGRIKREVEVEARVSSSGGSSIYTSTLRCGKGARCVNIQCVLDEIPARAATSVTMQIRIWEATFVEELQELDLVYINTSVLLTTAEDNIRFKGDQIRGTVQTTIDHEFFQSDITSTFPWWYILIGVILLLLLYILIIFLLIKCGFFKRKGYRPREEEDENVVSEESRRVDRQR